MTSLSRVYSLFIASPPNLIGNYGLTAQSAVIDIPKTGLGLNRASGADTAALHSDALAFAAISQTESQLFSAVKIRRTHPADTFFSALALIHID
jgi:hypothetical protein